MGQLRLRLQAEAVVGNRVERCWSNSAYSHSLSSLMTDRETGEFPRTRMRRMRRDDFSRRLMRENTLSAGQPDLSDVRHRGRGRREPIASMPGVERVTIDELVREAEVLAELDIPALALFPVTPRRRQERRRQRSVESRRTRAARRARSQEGRPASSASSPTSRSIPSRRTARTASSTSPAMS